VRELELDLDAFEGPFDLLLALVLKEELDLRDVDLAAIVTAFLERLAEREELDLEACGEFLVLIAALLELKSRLMLPGEEVEPIADRADISAMISCVHLVGPPVGRIVSQVGDALPLIC